MFAKYLVVIILPFYCSCIITDCKYYDEKCITGLAQQEYVDLINGRPGKVNTSDPMELEEIEGEFPDIKYTFRNLKLTGLRDCVPVLVHFTKFRTSDYHLHCPCLRIQSKYQIRGNLLHLKVDDKGDMDILCDDYNIVLHGALDVTPVESGNVIQITNFRSVGNIKGDVQLQMKSELKNNKDEHDLSVSKVLHENEKDVAVAFGSPIVEAVMTKLMQNLNHYLKLIPNEIKE